MNDFKSFPTVIVLIFKSKLPLLSEKQTLNFSSQVQNTKKKKKNLHI